MNKIILANAFSLQMLDLIKQHGVEITPVSLDYVKSALSHNRFTSAVGHEDTANVLTNMLGVKINPNRIDVKLDLDTMLIVAQLTGGRLPEGVKVLPENFDLKFFVVKIRWEAKKFSEPEIEIEEQNENSYTIEDENFDTEEKAQECVEKLESAWKEYTEENLLINENYVDAEEEYIDDITSLEIVLYTKSTINHLGMKEYLNENLTKEEINLIYSISYSVDDVWDEDYDGNAYVRIPDEKSIVIELNKPIEKKVKDLVKDHKEVYYVH